MRFVPGGPDFPVTLIKRWLRGQVILLAGAGVSMPPPSRLPSFKRLAVDVCDALHDQLPLADLDKVARTKRENFLDGLALTANIRVGADLYLAGDLDRFFSSMEGRIDRDAKGAAVSRRVREAIENRLRQHGGYAKGHRDLIRLSTSVGSSGPPCRIVTTNFDLLLEAAATAELGVAVTGVDARVAQRPGAYNFGGVIHLHGVLNENPAIPCDMVLTSRDFARAYLRAGVVANYVYDLVRRYTVLLVGYSADDPTMRYLMDAIGEDAALFSDMNQPYAVAGTVNASSRDIELWRAKNIEPILYKTLKGKDLHKPLWDSLAEWADWARDGMNWVHSILSKSTIVSVEKAGEFEKELVTELLSALNPSDQMSAISVLAGSRPSFGWVQVIADAVQPSHTSASEAWSVYKVWVTGRLSEAEAIAWAVESIRKIDGGLGTRHAFLIDELEAEARSDESIDSSVRLSWRMLRVAAADARSRPERWTFMQLRRDIAPSDYGYEEAEQIVENARPRLIAKLTDSSWDVLYGDSESGDRPLVSWDFEAACGSLSHLLPTIQSNYFPRMSENTLTNILEIGTAQLSRALVIASELDFDSFEYIGHVSTREQDAPQNSEERDTDAYNDDFAPLVRILSGAYTALTDLNPVSSLVWARSWSANGHSLFHRLSAFAFFGNEGGNPTEICDFLLALPEREFWNATFFPEIASLRASRWADMSVIGLQHLIDRLLGGPDGSSVFHAQVEQSYLDRVRDTELARIVDNSASFPDEFGRLVSLAREQGNIIPGFVPREVEPRARFVVEEVIGNPVLFEGNDGEELLIALVRNLGNGEFNEGDDAREFVRRNKLRVLEILSVVGPDNEYFDAVWKLAISWSHEFPSDEIQAAAIVQAASGLALRLSSSQISQSCREICAWLNSADAKFPNFTGANSIWHAVFDPAADLSNSRDTIQVEDEEYPDISSEAVNSALGDLFDFFGRRCPAIESGAGTDVLPQEYANRFKSLTGRARRIVSNRLIQNASYFWRADPPWILDFVIEPMRSDHSDGRLLWEAFAKYSPLPSSSLWQQLESNLLANLQSNRVSSDARRRLAEHALAAWAVSRRSQQYVVDTPAMRRALTLCSQDVRSAVSWAFGNLIRRSESSAESSSVSGTWLSVGRPFFLELWPLEPSLQSPSTSDDFARVPSLVGSEYFEEAVSTIIPYLRPFEVWDIAVFGLEGENVSLAAEFGGATLMLLHTCIPEEWGIVYGLGEVLATMATANPSISQDLRYRRLLRHAGAP